MKKSSDIYMVHDDTDIHYFNQLTPEELEFLESSPKLSKEELTEILLSSLID